MLWFRNCDPAYAFLWESPGQPAARWHGVGQGPVHYLADTPAGAWAELLRHEAITEAEDLADVARALWAVRVPDVDVAGAHHVRLARTVSTGGLDTYGRCQAYARRQRTAGATALLAPSAALSQGAAGGHHTDGGLRPGPAADGRVLVLIGARPDLMAWAVVTAGAPPADVLPVVRHL